MRKSLIILGAIIFCGSFLLLFLGPSLWMIRANRAFAVNDLQKAQQLYQSLAKALPKSPEIGYNLGLCQNQMGDYQAARRNFEHALRNVKANVKKGYSGKPKLLPDLLYYHLGNIAYKYAAVSDESTRLKFYRGALAYYKKALQANPGDMEAKYNYELVLLRINRSNQNGANTDQLTEPPDQSAVPNEEYFKQTPPGESVPRGNDW